MSAEEAIRLALTEAEAFLDAEGRSVAASDCAEAVPALDALVAERDRLAAELAQAERDWADQRQRAEAAEARADRLAEAVLAVFLDPLASHGARALARETLGIPYVPFASPEQMYESFAAASSGGEA